MKDNSEMESYLRYEFVKQPHSSFDKGVMRKTTKTVMTNALR